MTFKGLNNKWYITDNYFLVIYGQTKYGNILPFANIELRWKECKFGGNVLVDTQLTCSAQHK